jgi:N-acetylglutamate synthase-like GNAT family acetyltransferase
MSASGYVLRVATPDDAGAVDALLEASYPLLMAPFYDPAVLAPALKLMTKAQMSLLASGTYYVAETPPGLLVGCGGWTLERPGTGLIEADLAHIRHFGTHPAWTNRGIGRAIYRRCEAAARSAGVTRFECYSALNAEGFYASLRFASIRRMEMELEPNVALASVLMSREI